MSIKVPFIIVADDDSVSAQFKGLIQKVFPDANVYKYYDGIEAWEHIRSMKRRSIIISEYFIPKFSGLQILKNLRKDKHAADSYFIMVFDDKDEDSEIEILQKGADDVMKKPLNIARMITALRNSHSVYSLKESLEIETANIRQLEKELSSFVDKVREVLQITIKSRIPKSLVPSDKVVKASAWVASRFQNMDAVKMKTIITAAELCHLGRLALSDEDISKPHLKNGMVYRELMSKSPKYASEILSRISGLEEIGQILRHVYENHDGSGMPDQFRASQIPLGSKILRVILDFEEKMDETRGRVKKSMEHIYLESKRLYDYHVVALFDQYLAENRINDGNYREEGLELDKLVKGMTISRHIITRSGHKMLSGDQQLDDDKINKLKSLNKRDPIIGKVYIRKK